MLIFVKLEAAGIAYTPISYDWRLNERHYGALQGLSKERTADRLGRTLVMKWRRSYYARPPLMTADHPHYFMIECDGRYRHLKTQKKNQNHAIISPNNRVDNDNENEETNDSGITKGESLQDCQLRVIDVWENRIIKDIMQQEERQQQQQKQQEWNTNHNYNDNEPASPPYSLVVAHANTLRALVMHLDNIPPGKIESVNIPTAIPFFYDIDALTGNVIRHSRYASNEDDTGKMTTLQEGVFTGQYITDEMKKRNFLERRRAVQDPWLWALHDEQVAPGMLLRNQKDKNERQIGQQIGEVDLKNEEEQEEFFNDGEKESGSSVEEQDAETLKSIGEEAFRNTEMFARNLGRGRTRRSSFDEQ